jgi:hypothetical protein
MSVKAPWSMILNGRTIPNIKNNHVEKTVHPCQFPVELVKRLVLLMTRGGDWVLDPFVGVGSALIAAIKNGRRATGAELSSEYFVIASEARQSTPRFMARCASQAEPVCGLPRRSAPRHDEALDASRFLSRHNEAGRGRNNGTPARGNAANRQTAVMASEAKPSFHPLVTHHTRRPHEPTA